MSYGKLGLTLFLVITLSGIALGSFFKAWDHYETKQLIAQTEAEMKKLSYQSAADRAEANGWQNRIVSSRFPYKNNASEISQNDNLSRINASEPATSGVTNTEKTGRTTTSPWLRWPADDLLEPGR